MPRPGLNVASRFAHIDGLRAFAVLLVVVAHAGAGSVVPGGSGVTIFFTISGFIITHLLLKERDRAEGFNVRGFYWRRIVKIFPPFALIVIIPTLIWSIWFPIAWNKFLAQIFFVFNWVKINSDTGVFPGSAVVWSLSIEEQFYIVFALVWLLLARQTWWRAGTIAIATGLVVWSMTARFWFATIPGSEERIYYGTDTRMDGLAVGILAAVFLQAWSQRERPTRATRALGSDWAIVGAILLYLASLVIRDEWFRETLRYSFQSIAAAVLLLAPFMPGNGPIRRMIVRLSMWRPVELIGLASYSIYLVHLSVTVFLARVLPPLPLPIELVVFSAAGVGLGIAVYLWVEVPILAWRKRRDRRLTSVERQGLDTGI
ncbi:acyltransferase family protein [Microbacterium trichothecenolyticum]